MKKKVLSVFLILVLLLQLLPVTALAYPTPSVGAQNAVSKFQNGIPMSVSHRAAWRNGPECSLIALAASIRMGIDVAELDVKLTSDGVVVLSHDGSIDRCVANQSGSVGSYTWDQLKEFEVESGQGSSNVPYTVSESGAALLNSLPNYIAHSGEAVAGEGIPLARLDDALDLMKAIGPNTMINLDHCFSQDLFVACYEVFREKGMLGNVFFKNSNGAGTMDAWYAAAAAHWNENHPEDPITAQTVKDGILYVYIIRNADYSPLQAHLDGGHNLVMVEICIGNDDADAQIHEKLEPWCLENGVAMFVNTMWSGLCSTKGDMETTWAEMLDRGYVAIQTDRASELAYYMYDYNRTRASSETVQAEHFNLFNYESYGFNVPAACDSSLNKKVNGLRHGDWMSYKMSFDGGEAIMNLSVQGLDESGYLHIYLDERTEANRIATVTVSAASDYQTVSAEITGTITAGSHTLYIEAEGIPGTALANLDSFSFVPAGSFDGELDIETVSVTTEPGVAPKLPGTVAVTAGGTTYGLSVRWEQIPQTSYAAPGSFQVLGYVPVLEDYIQAEVTVVSVTPGITQDGLVLWMDASEGVTAEGAAVSTWASKVGGITASVNGGSPTVVENAAGGRAGIRFDGDDSLGLTLPSGFWNKENGQYTVLMYTSADEATSGNGSAVSGPSTSGSQQYSVMWFPEVGDWGGVYFTASQNEVIWRFGSGSNGDRGSTYVRSSSVGELFNASAIRKNGDTNAVFVNGGKAYTGAAVSAVTQNTGSAGHIGKGQYGNFSGTVCQILIYDRALTDQEIIAAQRWMAQRYADTITSVGSAAVSCEAGTAPELPETVEVTYASGAKAQAAVKWESINPNSYLTAGTFEASGTLPGGQSVTATVTVTQKTEAVFPDSSAILWFSAKEGLTADTDGKVSAWVDKAANVTASQATAGSQPVLVKDGSGNVIGVNFNGSNKLTFDAGKETFNNLSGLTIVAYTVPEMAAPSSINDNHNSSVIYFGESGSWSGMYLGAFTNGGSGRFGTGVAQYRGVLYGGGSYTGATTTVLRKDGAKLDELIINGTAIADPQTGSGGYADATHYIDGSKGQLGNGKNAAWKGTIREVIIFNKALTDAELEKVYEYFDDTYNKSAEEFPLDGLMLWLDGGSGITDSNGTVTNWVSKAGSVSAVSKKGAPTLVTDPVSKQAGVCFDGDDVLKVEMASGSFNGLTGATVIAYAKPEQTINTADLNYYGQRNTLFTVDEAGSWGSFYVGVYTNAVSARFGTGVSNDAGFSVARPSAVTGFTTTMVRWDGSTMAYDAQVDGAAFTTAASKAGVTGNNSNIIYLGTGKQDLQWKGTLCELLIYDRALTDAQIQAVYDYLDEKYAPVVDPTVNVTGIYLKESGSRLELEPGTEHTMTASAIPANADDPTLVWSSSNDAVVSVDQNGKVTALKAGLAVITVTTRDGNYQATCVVRVQKPTTAALWEDIQNLRAWAAQQDPEDYNNFATVMTTALFETKNVKESDDLQTLQEAYNILRDAKLALERHVHVTTLVDEVAAKCTEPGHTAYYTCPCGRWFADQAATREITDKNSVVLTPIDHDWADATCTAPKTCKREGCGATEGEATSHDLTAATCKSKAFCKECEQFFGEEDPGNHAGKAVWTYTDTSHESAYDCCGEPVVASEAHKLVGGACECGYRPAEPGKVENTTDHKNNALSAELTVKEEHLAESILTAEDKAQVEKGQDIAIYLKVEDIGTGISAGDKALIAEKLGSGTVGVYLDVSLFKQVSGQEPVAVTKTAKPVTVSLTLPAELRNLDKAVERTYKVIHIHDGKAELLVPTYDEKSNTLSFQTDCFSVYALTYTDKTLTNGTPSTGDQSPVILWTALLALSAVAMTALILVKRKEMNG